MTPPILLPLAVDPVLLGAIHAAVLVVMALVALLGGGPLAQEVFRRVDREARLMAERREQENRSPDDARPPGQGVVAAAHVLPGGAWIGMLERLAIFAGLVCHYPEAIAICLALKGLARYPELKATTSGAAERFIIGTFVSVLLACGCAGVALWINGPVLGRMLG